MLTSLAYIFLTGLAMAWISQRLRLPRIIGMLLTGVVLGPHVLNLLSPEMLGISADLRKMALVIILIKAGLSLNLSDLRQVGRPAMMLSFVPASCEIAAYVLLAPILLRISRTEAAVMGAVLAAVSPAVVVPRMVQLMEEHRGTEQHIPQMILAGASMDDVFVIVLFTTFCSIAQGNGASIWDFANIPISILTGIAGGAAVGICLAWFFETNASRRHLIRNSVKVVIVLGVSFLLLAVEDWLSETVGFSGLLAIMSMSMALAAKCVPAVTARLQQKYGKLWIAAEVILFVLVGAAVDIRYTMEAGAAAAAMILLALVFRCFGVWLCMLGTKLNGKERVYCMISYLPKATVQAAIGAVPLSMGLPCGKLVLSVAVLAILITAPLGAIGMDTFASRLLVQSDHA